MTKWGRPGTTWQSARSWSLAAGPVCWWDHYSLRLLYYAMSLYTILESIIVYYNVI